MLDGHRVARGFSVNGRVTVGALPLTEGVPLVLDWTAAIPHVRDGARHPKKATRFFAKENE